MWHCCALGCDRGAVVGLVGDEDIRSPIGGQAQQLRRPHLRDAAGVGVADDPALALDVLERDPLRRDVGLRGEEAQARCLDDRAFAGLARSSSRCRQQRSTRRSPGWLTAALDGASRWYSLWTDGNEGGALT